MSEPMNLLRTRKMKSLPFVLCTLCLGFLLATRLGASSSTRRGQTQPQAPPAGPVHSSTSGTPPSRSAVPNEDFIIGPEDVLEISVWREPDLAMKATVRPDGKIGVRLLNDVQASGLTTAQLQDRLQAGFARFVSEPVVSVIVTDVRSQMVHVIGSVGRPGVYPLGGPLTIMEILARAGGLTEFAKKEDIGIVRSEGGKTHRMPFNYKKFIEGTDLQQNILLRAGDVIVVP
jgi:polysaccharide biosynthesis/export protein